MGNHIIIMTTSLHTHTHLPCSCVLQRPSPINQGAFKSIENIKRLNPFRGSALIAYYTVITCVRPVAWEAETPRWRYIYSFMVEQMVLVVATRAFMRGLFWWAKRNSGRSNGTSGVLEGHTAAEVTCLPACGLSSTRETNSCWSNNSKSEFWPQCLRNDVKTVYWLKK